MDMPTIGAAIAGSSALGGLVLYVIRAEMRGDVTRLDGRINGHEATCEGRERLHDERHAATNAQLDKMDKKLDRILERK